MRLRGHHILCLHGWRGYGYSPKFTASMQSIRSRLASTPDLFVQVIDSPDDICDSCPHLSDGRCAKRGGASEDRVSARDVAILSALRLTSGDRIKASELFTRASDRFGTVGLGEVCGACRWLGYGWCEQGIRDRVMLAVSTRGIAKPGCDVSS